MVPMEMSQLSRSSISSLARTQKDFTSWSITNASTSRTWLASSARAASKDAVNRNWSFTDFSIRSIKRSSQVLTAVVSAGVAIVFAGLDNKLGLMVAVFAGLLVAVIMEWREPS